MKFSRVFENQNSGSELKSVQKVDSTSKEDMDAFDQFGPKTRDYMNNHMKVKWSAAETLKHVKRMGMDPSHPHVDDAIVGQLKMANDRVGREIRVESVILEAVESLL